LLYSECTKLYYEYSSKSACTKGFLLLLIVIAWRGWDLPSPPGFPMATWVSYGRLGCLAGSGFAFAAWVSYGFPIGFPTGFPIGCPIGFPTGFLWVHCLGSTRGYHVIILRMYYIILRMNYTRLVVHYTNAVEGIIKQHSSLFFVRFKLYGPGALTWLQNCLNLLGFALPPTT